MNIYSFAYIRKISYNALMKLLMISWQNFIEKRDDGGKQASYRLYELAKAVCPETDLILFIKDEMLPENEHLKMPSHRNIICRGINILTGHLFTSKSIELQAINRIKSGGYDTVLLDRSMYGKFSSMIKKECPNVKIWVFFHNIEKNYFKNKIKNNPLLYLPYFSIAKSEHETINNADRIMTLTGRDSNTLKEMYGRSSDQVLPMAFYDLFEESRLLPDEENRFNGNILFIGSMFGPNYEGIKWFVENVMPELPECNLTIVGKNFEKKRDELTRDNVTVVGTVNDLSEYYYANNIMVMPIPYGDGIKIKTAEAIMYGKTILASDEALEGYDVDGVEGIYRCNTKEDYIATIKNSLQNSSSTFCPEVRRLFIEKHCLDRQIEEFTQLI